MTMTARPVGSLCVHTALTCQRVRVRGLRSNPCLANVFASCKKQLSWQNCASFVPLGMKWACICAGNGCSDSMCEYVLSSLCCWLPQCWRRCVGCSVVVTVPKKKKKTKSVTTKKNPARKFFTITVFFEFKNVKSASNYEYYRFSIYSKK